MKDRAWDDAAFKERVKAAAQRKGITMRQALEAAGVSPYYLKKTVEGRSTNTVLRLARVLDVPPAEMMGLTAEPEISPPSAQSEAPRIDGERLRRITVAAQIMAAQLAALLYVASDRSDADPAVLVERILRELKNKNPGGKTNE